MARRHVRHSPLLGTTVDVTVETATHRSRWSKTSARSVEQRLVGELHRLENIFNVYDPASEISQLRQRVAEHFRASDGLAEPLTAEVSDDLASVLSLSLTWHRSSEGRFNPLIGSAVALWADSEKREVMPDADLLSALATGAGIMPFSINGQTVTVTDRLDGLNVNSLAKGWILDRAIERCGQEHTVTVNAGGDISRRGRGGLDVRIEDPSRPYDNAAPLTVVRLAQGGLATSGGSRRSVEIGGVTYSHLLDADTGWPAGEVAAATVIAADTATADVLATVLATGSLGDASALVSSDLLEDHRAAALVVGPDGRRYENFRWQEHQIDWSGH